MSDELKLSTYGIVDIGNFISEKLSEYNVRDASLTINLSSKDFSKVDEDLFYRNNTNDSTKYVPSEDCINVSFDNVDIVITNKKELGLQ